MSNQEDTEVALPTEDGPGFNAVIAALRLANPDAEDESFAWNDVVDLLYLTLTNTDVTPARKSHTRSNATSIELTDAGDAKPSKVFDFFPTLAISERYPTRRIAVVVRWRLENVAALASRFADVSVDEIGPGWRIDKLQIRRSRNRNTSSNPGLHIGYESDLHPLRNVLAVDDVLAIVRRNGATSYEAFGIAADHVIPALPKGKRLLVGPVAPDQSQLWTFANRIGRSSTSSQPEPGPTARREIDRVVSLAKRHGPDSIVALAGVPGTGKTYTAERAAIHLAGNRDRVEVVQFHASYAYEEFIEGLDLEGKPTRGVLHRFNERALGDYDNTYVFVIEELTRADLSSVLGELLTYVEYRDRSVTLPYSRTRFQIASNLVIMATYNPTDRSALEVDAALLRRLRIVDFLPSAILASELLIANGIPLDIAERAARILEVHEDDPKWMFRMPFGHGIFAGVRSEDDLYDLWDERIRRFLYGPWENHPYTEAIVAAYPWRRTGGVAP